MENIQQKAIDYADNIERPGCSYNQGLQRGFTEGFKEALKWIPIEEELPEQITNPVKQTNGNILYFYEKYLIKGHYYHGDRIVREVVFTATYMPYSVSWYFNVDDPDAENSLPFRVTHWRTIEYK